MKPRPILILCCALVSLGPVSAAPLGTAFTYQGQLADAGAPVNGLYDLKFTLYDAATNGAPVGLVLTTNALSVSNGLFAAALDFGADVFAGEARWLEIALRTNGAGLFITLEPRQPLTPTPYAAYAPQAGSAATATTASQAAVASGVVANAVTSSGIAAGQVVKSLNGLRDDVILAPGANVTVTPSGQFLTVASPSDWHLGGNAGTIPGVNFLGNIDDQPLQLRVNNSPTLRLEHSGDGYNVIGGHAANTVALGVVGATISGGGNTTGSVGGYTPNSIAANYASIGGGGGNQIQVGAFNSAIAGGGGNQVATGAYDSAIGGGYFNVVAGRFGTVPGGANNSASGDYSLAAGRRANALHDGAFVWADSQNADFGSSGTNQFLVRASGGLQVFDGSLMVDSGGANTNGALNPAPGLLFGGPGSGEGIASKRLNDGIGNTWGLDFFTSFAPRLSIANSGDAWIYDHTLFLRGAFDQNHGLGWFGGAKTFAGASLDGPVLFGYSGGALGTEQSGAEHIALAWTTSGVGVGKTNPATVLDVNGTATIRGDLIVHGSVSNATPVMRYVPITVGDLVHTTANSTGDSTTGIQFPAGQQSGGTISFPLPPDYLLGTSFALELYLIPATAGSGNINFYTRWVGVSNGSFSGTGGSRTSTAVAAGTAGNVQKQNFTMPAFSGTLPEMVLLTIRREPSTDTYPGTVVLNGLRLSYQANR